MSLDSYDIAINEAVGERRRQLAQHLSATVIFYYGPLFYQSVKVFRDFIESERKADETDPKHGATSRLVVVLNTPGGTAEAVEKMVEIIRHHYSEVFFVVPDQAMSAGTILCMSGNKIYMDYSSSLGPIDPQVVGKDGNSLVPAMGYLDQAKKLIEKSSNGTITGAELALIQNLDLGMLDLYEKAQALTITLLKKWLVDYKFQTWTEHRTSPDKRGQPVTADEKLARAEKIAKQLSDNGLWQSHGRYIGIDTLRKVLQLEIEDYSKDATLRDLIRGYHDLLVEFARTKKAAFLLDGRHA